MMDDDGYLSDTPEDDRMWGLRYPATKDCCGKFTPAVIERYPYGALAVIFRKVLKLELTSRDIRQIGRALNNRVIRREALFEKMENPYEFMSNIVQHKCCCTYMNLFRYTAHVYVRRK